MSYVFPPPVSLAWTISFVALLVALPLSIIACGVRPPKSKRIWRLTVAFWLICLPALLILSGLIGIPWKVLIAVRAGIIAMSLGALTCDYFGLFADRRTTRRYYSIPKQWLTITVLFVLLCIFLEPIGYPPEARHRMTCKSHLQQIGLAFHNYYDDHNAFPLGVGQRPARTWRIDLLPYMGHENDYKAYDQSQDWDSVSNTALTKTEIQQYQCPSAPKHTLQDPAGRMYTAYGLLDGSGTAAAWMRRTQKSQPAGWDGAHSSRCRSLRPADCLD